MQTIQPINQQLADIKTQLDAASERAVSVVNVVDFEKLKQRPQPDEWSIAECLVHLNLSSQAEIAAINPVIENALPENPAAAKLFKMDWLGGILKWTLEPPPMFFSKMKTKKPFEPLAVESPDEILPAFLGWQEKLKTTVDRCAGLPLDRLKVASPFDTRFKYNLFSFFHILLAHERRHLWQAERVREIIVR